MTVISCKYDSKLSSKHQARDTVQNLLDAPQFGSVVGAMNQGGLRGHNFSAYGRRAFKDSMLQIIGFKYSGKVSFNFADNTLQEVVIY